MNKFIFSAAFLLSAPVFAGNAHHGFYVGGGFGGAISSTKTPESIYISAIGESISFNQHLGFSGFEGGAYLGYTHKFCDRYVIGAEIGMYAGNVKGHQSFRVSAAALNIDGFMDWSIRQNYISEFAVKAGVLTLKDALIYSKIGLAHSRWTGSLDSLAHGDADTIHRHKNVQSCIAGLGIEVPVLHDDRVVFGGEWVYSHSLSKVVFDSVTFPDPFTAGGTVLTRYTIKPRLHHIRLRVLYRF